MAQKLEILLMEIQRVMFTWDVVCFEDFLCMFVSIAVYLSL